MFEWGIEMHRLCKGSLREALLSACRPKQSAQVFAPSLVRSNSRLSTESQAIRCRDNSVHAIVNFGTISHTGLLSMATGVLEQVVLAFSAQISELQQATLLRADGALPCS